MIDPIAFIEARLAADEQTAKAAIGAGERGEWTADGCCVEGDIHIYDEGGHDERQAEHIARHDPARVLREVEAKRQLLEMYREAKVYYDANRSAPAGEAHGLWTAVRLLALAWADHPDYRAEWT